jgi:hypothetical protein
MFIHCALVACILYYELANDILPHAGVRRVSPFEHMEMPPTLGAGRCRALKQRRGGGETVGRLSKGPRKDLDVAGRSRGRDGALEELFPDAAPLPAHTGNHQVVVGQKRAQSPAAPSWQLPWLLHASFDAWSPPCYRRRRCRCRRRC